MKKFTIIIYFILFISEVYSQTVIQQIFYCDSIYISEFKKFTNINSGNKNFYFMLGTEGSSMFSQDVRNKRWYRYMYNTGQFVYDMHNSILGSSLQVCPPYGFITYHYTENFVISFKDTNLILFSNAGTNCVEAYGYVRYTTNNGLNWLQTPYWNDFLGSGLRGFDIDRYNDSIMYVAYEMITTPGNIFKSSNRGINWVTMDTVPNIGNSIRMLVTDRMKRNYLYLTKQKGILRSTDGGRMFHEVNCDTAVVSSIEFDMTDSSVYLTSSSGSVGIFKSTDHGGNWTKILNKQCYAMEIDPSNHNNLYAGVDSVIYGSTNAGLNWTLFYDGIFPKKQIVGICKNPGGDTLYVAARKGVYKIWGKYIGINNISNEILEGFNLYQNYPNPFNPMTIIKYEIPFDENVSFVVYDIIGKEIINKTGYIKAGKYEFRFDGSNLASGVYFYSLKINDYFETKKMILMK